MIKQPPSPAIGKALRRLALYGGLILFSVYAILVLGGYAWLHYARKNDQVGLLDVALIRLGSIRSSLAAQHFAEAQKEWDAKRIPAAYLLFSAAVRQDPYNVPGRLKAVEFLRSLGGGKLALVMLEEGLAYLPDDRRLIEATFDYLLVTGRDRRALDLLKLRYGSAFSGPNATLLQRYEVQATLVTDGAAAAKRLLDQHPQLLQDTPSAPAVARIWWETQERTKAISLLRSYVQTQPAPYPEYAQLAAWQLASRLSTDAIQTVRTAIAKFPQELAPRILLIDVLLTSGPNDPAGQEAITAYLRDFAGRPESILELASYAGRKGLVELARSLYQIGATRQVDLNLLAIYYSDALVREQRFKEIREILSQVESQAPENNPNFMLQLRQRQVINAAALGDSDNVREYTRRLASTLAQDPDGLDICRRLFRKLGINEAVAELAGRSTTAPTTAAAARKQI